MAASNVDPRGTNLDLRMAQGKTFTRVIRYGKKPFVFKDITAIAKSAPALITAPTHGLVEGWPVAVVGVQGMRQINANDPPRASDFYPATVVNANQIELQDINSANFSTYASGGWLQYHTPVVLTGGIARMTIRDYIGGTALLELTSVAEAGFVIDDAAYTITLTVTDEQTEAADWTDAVYDIEFEDATGAVFGIFYGAVSLAQESTT
jgi:hypothetical protein